MSFAHPFLAFSAGIVFLGGLLAPCLLGRHDRSNAFVYSDLEFLCGAVQSHSWVSETAAVARASAIAALVLAAAQPAWQMQTALPLADLIICLDTSGSMSASDYRPTRLGAVKQAVHAFTRAHPERKMLLIAFAGTARVVSGADAIPAPNGQTAIGSALLAALRIAQRHTSRDVVLITDGASNTGPAPSIVVTELRAVHIALHVILLGGNASLERTMRAYADRRGGTFAHPRDPRAIPAALERAAAVRRFHIVRRDMTVPLAASALCVLLAGTLGPLAAGYFLRESEPDGDAALRYRDDAPYV